MTAGEDAGASPLPPLPAARDLGDVVLGTVDGAWWIDRISADVTALLGITPEQCLGVPVLGAVHPADAPGFIAAVEHARRGDRGVAGPAAQRPGAAVARGLGHFRARRPGGPTRAGVRPRPDRQGARGPAVAAGRDARLETHLLRIADEPHAAGLLPQLERLPAHAGNPRLGLLTSREWAVLTRLLEGQRVSDIAASLVVSPSTVRNHLSSIYAKLRVNGQVDLIRTRRGQTPS